MEAALQTRSFKFGDHTVRVKCRQSPDADEFPATRCDQQPEELVTDTVGWDIWDGATIAMCEKMVQNPEIVMGKRVLELGAGVGVVGVLAGLLGARSVMITDYDEGAIGIAAMNIDLNRLSSTCTVQKYDWGSDSPPSPTPEKGEDDRQRRIFDVVLGSDLLYSSSMADKLHDAVRAVLRDSPGCSMLLSHQLRHSVTWNERREPVVEDHDSVLLKFLSSCSYVLPTTSSDPMTVDSGATLVCTQLEKQGATQSEGTRAYTGGEGDVCVFEIKRIVP